MGKTKDAGNSQESTGQITHPDPKRHFQLSMIKSAIRIVAGGALCLLGNTWLIVAGVALIIGELVGIAEEMV